jgi:hypothetical protein
MYLLIWTVHGLIYRWPATRVSNEAIEAWLARAAEGLRSAFAALAALVRRLVAHAGKGS